MNLQYDWGRKKVMKEGFYIALKSENNKLSPVVVCAEKDSLGNYGWSGFTGPNFKVSAGNPRVNPFEEDFVVWARLPDPM